MTEESKRASEVQSALVAVLQRIRNIRPLGDSIASLQVRWVAAVEVDPVVMGTVGRYPEIAELAIILPQRNSREEWAVLTAAATNLLAATRYTAGPLFRKLASDANIVHRPMESAWFEHDLREADSEPGIRLRPRPVHEEARGRGRPEGPLPHTMAREADMEAAFLARDSADQVRILRRGAKAFIEAHKARWDVEKSQAYGDWARVRIRLAERGKHPGAIPD